MPTATPVVVVFIAAVLLATVGWFLVPKGAQQVLFRTMVALTIACCYLMWAITYLAQLHPLIAPVRSDVRIGESSL
ncbi:hypothetical protein DL93DRAFT_2082615 [Clavulina sp. PMI_390]|nr:hypothetical protein DL93DRAFT_2082615 [Clavulina sp. PMI_390]